MKFLGKLKLVEKENLHSTIKFLGEVLPEEKIEKRLKKALDEIAMGRSSDYIVVNEDGKFKETITSVFGIIKSFLKK